MQNLPLNVKDLPDFDQNKVKPAILERFYAGKIDLNLAGRSEIEEALGRIDPLGVGAGSEKRM